MLSDRPSDVLVQRCLKLGDNAADSDGFVSVSALARAFGARIELRPLLVEAMLASDVTTAESDPVQWVVLLDSERHRVSQDALERESPTSPLPVRVRNTVAHELVHSLAFRVVGDQLHPTSERRPGENRAAWVERIERETERLSPLLLVPSRALKSLLARPGVPISIEELDQLRRTLAVSREVLVNRFMLLEYTGEELLRSERSRLHNTAIGLAKKSDGGQFAFRRWPLFIQFANNRPPRFLERINKQGPMPAADLLPRSEFVLCGGRDPRLSFEDECYGGGMAYEPCTVSLSVEGNAKAGSQLMFLVRRPT